MNINLIQTLPQNFIESNIQELCKIIFNIDIRTNNIVSVSLKKEFGFEYKNFTKANNTNTLSTEEKTKTAINKFLEEKNKKLSDFFKQKELSINYDFFPLSYIQLSSIKPIAKSIKNKEVISSWELIFKLKAPSYKEPQNNQEYTNLINGGININIGVNGIITRLDYNFLPIKSFEKKNLNKVISDEEVIPEIVYILNSQKNTIAPFFLSAKKDTYVPATKESSLPINFNLYENVDSSKDVIEKYKKGILDEKIYYTCNAGWIDSTHAFDESNRKNIGAKNLWNQIIDETGLKSESPNDNGFQVIYRQDAEVFSGLPTIGVTKKYFVSYGLSLVKKERIALTIFQEVSVEFEQLQSFGKYIGRGDSSFEPADLISNLIGFYSAVRPSLGGKEGVLKLCKKLGVAQSLSIYKDYPGTFTEEKYKNRSFIPLFFPNKFCQNSVFPQEFQEIETIQKDKDFRSWIDLFDVYGGVPPIYNSPKY